MERTMPAEFSRGQPYMFREKGKPEQHTEPALKRVLYGAWDGTKRAIERQSPNAWQERILHVVEARILPTLEDDRQKYLLDNWEKVETAAKYAGVAITASEIAALFGGVYLGKRFLDQRNKKDRYPSWRIRKKKLRHPHRYSVSVDISDMKAPDPRDADTLKEFAAALDRVVPERKLRYRTRKGTIINLEKRKSPWKERAVAALGEILQETPSLPSAYLRIPSIPTNEVFLPHDEAAVRERIAESMIHGWSFTHHVSNDQEKRDLLTLWRDTNLMGIPRLDPHDMATFASRYVKPDDLSDFAKRHLVVPVPQQVSRLSRILHLRDHAPTPLTDARFALPVQHALQRVSAIARREGGRHMTEFMQSQRVIEALWTHRENPTIVQNLDLFATATNEVQQRQALSNMLTVISRTKFSDLDQWALWRKNNPKQEITPIVEFMRSKGFPGIGELARAIHTA